MTDVTQTDPVNDAAEVALLRQQLAALQAQVDKPGVLAVTGSWLAKWHPVILGAAMATVPPLLNYLGTVPWETLGVSPSAAAIIGVVIVTLRSTTLAVQK
jgi:hypothetical protein